MFQPMLFADALDFGQAEPGGTGCAAPIGRRTRLRRASRGRAVRPRRPSTAMVLAELRAELHTLGEALVVDRRRRSRDSEMLGAMLRQIVEVRRHLGLTELHQAPRSSRRRPLGT